jgi:hypothetical protein
LPRPCSSRAPAATSTIARWTAASADGRGSSCSSRRSASSSTGISARGGSSSRTRISRARSKCGCRRDSRPDASRARAPQSRSSRHRVGVGARRGRRRCGLAALPAALRGALRARGPLSSGRCRVTP